MREMEKHGQRRNHEYQERMAQIIEDIVKNATAVPVSPTASMREAAVESPCKKNTAAAPGSPIQVTPTRVVLSPPKTLQDSAEKAERPVLQGLRFNRFNRFNRFIRHRFNRFIRHRFIRHRFIRHLLLLFNAVFLAPWATICFRACHYITYYLAQLL